MGNGLEGLTFSTRILPIENACVTQIQEKLSFLKYALDFSYIIYEIYTSI